jgi:aconitate hydratase
MNRVDERQVRQYYVGLAAKHADARRRFGRPLTLAEKILTAHLDRWNEGENAPERGNPLSFLLLVFVRGQDATAQMALLQYMQDATAQMALLQYMQADMGKVAVPTTIHCDHLIRAQVGASADLQRALTENDEVYRFLKSAAQKHGIGFWPPGSGIIHQVVLEKYAYPGGLIIGTDSHTPNAGGLGMLAIGVGGADAMEVMAGQAWSVKWPKLIGVRLTGKLNGWTAPKDVILKLAGLLTVEGGTGAIIEYFGDGARTISCTGKATITNMGAELGATTSVFPFDRKMAEYLRATERGDIADLAESSAHLLTADPEVEADYARYFDKVIEIDLSTLEPHVVGPHTPDLARPISELKKELEEKGYPRDLRYALIGSCTNSSYEDMTAAASVARQAQAAGIKAKIGLLVTPGSDQIMRTLQRDSIISVLESIGGTVLANACGPCIGQWQRSDVKEGEANSIISSFNRNFPRRNDGFASTLSFIASPEIVTAIALSGDLGFNPLTDPIVLPDGRSIMLEPPISHELPEQGFVFDSTAFIAPAEDGSQVKVEIAANSKRLELLTPLTPWVDTGVVNAPVLLKAAGKCTTDHISPAGPWLKYRGHLTNISDNMFNGANNAFTGASGTGVDVTTGQTAPLHVVAKSYRAQNLNWVVIGDYNYGEGSSREHAAMSPRFLGCAAIIARSFARIHETNLKKQGILALTFADPADYERVAATDRFNLPSPRDLAPGKQVTVTVVREDGSRYTLTLNHTLTATEIGWFRAGSMLNAIKEERQAKPEEDEGEEEQCTHCRCSVDTTPKVEAPRRSWWLARFWRWLWSGLFGR